MINYKSFEDLNNSILRNLYKFPHDADLIVGIPRSGMLPANLLALYLNKPYTSVEQLCNGVVYANGSRNIDTNSIRKVLIIDDSVSSGASMAKARKMLSTIEAEKIFATVYITSQSINKVDVYCDVVNQPRLFQWNIFNTARVKDAIMDMDGVLCEDPAIDDDGELYVKEITNAKPLYIPKYTIDAIVTCRLEKYRQITEKWLQDHNVSYNKLIMLPFNTKAERLAWGKHGIWKGEVFRDSKDYLFYESSLRQAKQIKSVTSKDVFCTEIMKFV